MKKYFRQTLTALLCGAMFFASCKDEPEVVKSSDCEIVSFSVNALTWNISGTNITHTYPAETQVGPLTPTINLSPGATVNPPAEAEQNFFTEQGVTYTVTAEDGVTTKTYTARATRTSGAESEILSFSVNGTAWTIGDTLITHSYPPETTADPLTPTITLSPGATVNPPAGVAQNFFAEGGVTYTVTSEDGTATKTYTAKARLISRACDILSFVVEDEVWDINGTDITFAHPPEIAGTPVASHSYILPHMIDGGDETPIIIVSPGARVNPGSGVPQQNFYTEEGVTYTVTAEDGVTQKIYTAKATVQVMSKYVTRDWTVVTKNNYNWGDGRGSQTLWPGGHSMLLLDDDPASGWHSQLGASLPNVIVVDMKNSNPIYMIHAVGDYFHKLQIYLTDELPYPGYVPYTVDWDDENNRYGNYDQWLSSARNLIPSGMPLSSWGTPIVDETLTVKSTFTFTFAEENVQGRYLILLFPDNDSDGYHTYCAMSTLEVYYVE
jgi:hypothetical protein